MLKMSENPFLSTKEVTDKVDDNSTKYLLQAGYIRQELGGVFNYLPLGYKVLNNIKSIITKHLEKLGAQEILMSSIGSKEHWEQTGRNNIDILFKLPSS
jgi:prolyl-tRNA synthetase